MESRASLSSAQNAAWCSWGGQAAGHSTGLPLVTLAARGFQCSQGLSVLRLQSVPSLRGSLVCHKHLNMDSAKRNLHSQ